MPHEKVGGGYLITTCGINKWLSGVVEPLKGQTKEKGDNGRL